jgi:hypothetical protein
MATTQSQPLSHAALDLQQLPNDAPTLKGMIIELLQQLQQEQQHAAHLQARLEQLLRRLYGRRSERLDPGQLSLFAAGQEASTTPAAPLPEESGNDTSRPSAGRPAGRSARRRAGQGGQGMAGNACPNTCHAESCVTS